MATIKSYSDLQQSKVLAKILPLESADMGWYYTSNPNAARNQMWVGTKAENADIPCWSLAALLELTPNDVSLLHLEDVYQAVYDVKPYYITNRFDNPLDATFEMICWLKENNKL